MPSSTPFRSPFGGGPTGWRGDGRHPELLHDFVAKVGPAAEEPDRVVERPADGLSLPRRNAVRNIEQERGSVPPGEIPAVPPQRAGVERQQTGETFEQGGLA